MEAMASGCCCVASNAGGNPELIVHRERGPLFEKGNVTALTEALRLLVQDDTLRLQLASSASEFIRRNFSPEVAGARMAEISSTILRERICQ